MKDEGIVSYYPSSKTDIKESGFYFNEDTQWYEIWWNHNELNIYSNSNEISMIATAKYEYHIEHLLLEALSYWRGRMDKVLNNVIKH